MTDINVILPGKSKYAIKFCRRIINLRAMVYFVQKVHVFETVILNNGTVDLSLTLPLTERVIVKRQDNGTLDITFPQEPQYEEPLDPQPMQLIDSNTGEILAQWTSTAP